MNGIFEARAKINLALSITGRLDNGYHTIRSVMVPLSLCDRIYIQLEGQSPRSSAPQISCSADWATGITGAPIPTHRDNLAFRAAQALFDHPFCKTESVTWPHRVHLHIEKYIPMGGGLGGGSADAAAVLTGLGQLMGLGESTSWKAQRHHLASKLGADIPFLLQSQPCLCSGIGDVLSPLPWAEEWGQYFVYYLSPGLMISTPWAYSRWDEMRLTPSNPWDADLQTVLKLGTNDFERVVFPRHPQLQEAVSVMAKAGAEKAGMTGSGSTLFAVSRNMEDIKNIDFNVRNIFTREFKNHGWYSGFTKAFFGCGSSQGETTGADHRGQDFSSFR